MDKLEKVERLRACADVSYEEALAALEACDGDLLDAMVYLEKEGKIQKPGQSTYSTDYKEQEEYINVTDKVEQQKKDAPSLGKSISKLFHTLARFVKHTSFRITKNDDEILRVPSWVLAIVILITWKGVFFAALIGLLLGFRFSFESHEKAENTDAANDFLSKAGDIADDVKEGFRSGLNKGDQSNS